MKKAIKPICVILSAIMLLSILAIAPISASARVATGAGVTESVTFSPGFAGYDEEYIWVAYTWENNKSSGEIVYGTKGTLDDTTVFTFSGLKKNVAFGTIYNDGETFEWEDTDEKTIDYVVSAKYFTITGWYEQDEVSGGEDSESEDFYVGTWSNEGIVTDFDDDDDGDDDESSETYSDDPVSSDESVYSDDSAPIEDTDVVIFDAGDMDDESYNWAAYTWSDDKNAGSMILGTRVKGKVVFRGLSDKVIFGMIDSDIKNPTWEDKESYTTIDYDVAGNSFAITGWSDDDNDIYEVWGTDYYIGEWANIVITENMVKTNEDPVSSDDSASSEFGPVDRSIVFLDPGDMDDEDYNWVAYTWSDNKDAGTMIVGTRVNDKIVFRNLSEKVIFGTVSSDIKNPTWANKEEYTTIDYYVAGNSFTITGWSEDDDDIFETWGYDYYIGEWKNIVINQEMLKSNNTLTVSASTKTVKAVALKKAAATLKPITINKAKGAVTVEKVKGGTTASIYDKVTVNKTTGAFTLKKGSYKPGTYKVAVSVTAAGNNSYKAKTVKKTATIKIKDKAKNTLSVKASTKTLKLYYMKKAKKTVKPIKISKAKGKVKVVKVKKGTTAKIYKKISVNKKTGAITFKKGSYKKGTYKVKLKITAKGNDNYKSKAINKIVKIKIKDRKSNTLFVKAIDDGFLTSKLKKSKKTIKPFHIVSAKGKVKVVKLKKGTSAKIYKKITVNKKTGAVTFKKGKYKAGTYKIRIKVTAKGNGEYKPKTIKKTVTIYLKEEKKVKKEKSSSRSSSSSSSSGSSGSSSSSSSSHYGVPGYNTVICGACGGTGHRSITIMQTQTIGFNPVTGMPQTIQMPHTDIIPCGTCGGDGRI